MEIQEAIIHRLIKEARQTGDADVDYRQDRLPINDVLIKLAQEVIKVYHRNANGYGTFHEDENLYRFPKLASEYLTGECDFVDFSKTTADLITNQMKSSTFASGGYLLIIRLTIGERDLLIAALLKLKPGTAIEEDTKNLIESLGLDVDHLHEAARIDINKWQEDSHPYLSFVKKSSGNSDVTLYFRNALGCSDYTDSKHHTQQVMQAIDDYMENQDWDKDKKIHIRQKVHEYFKLKTENKEPANLTSVSSIIDDQNPDNFKNHVQDGEYGVNETFEPHPKTYRRYHRIAGKLGNISLSFNVSDVTDGKINYDEESGNIIISGGTESKIVQDIREYQNDDPD
ncbi:nucleoid-associated protein [Marinobacter sp.]|uniref:nucleoid-associated protein n=1 Tax=Marinobacter sp. TaxID=50741 RepID=UPI003A94018E